MTTPTALLYMDFQNNIYTVAGERVALSDLWSPSPINLPLTNFSVTNECIATERLINEINDALPIGVIVAQFIDMTPQPTGTTDSIFANFAIGAGADQLKLSSNPVEQSFTVGGFSGGGSIPCPSETPHQIAVDNSFKYSLDGSAVAIFPFVGGPGWAALDMGLIAGAFNTSSNQSIIPTGSLLFLAIYNIVGLSSGDIDALYPQLSVIGARPGNPGIQNSTLSKPYQPATPLNGGVMPCCVPGGFCHC